MRRVALIDDEPMNVGHLSAVLPRLVSAPIEVATFARPRVLAEYLHLADVDCAIVDLSFGVDDRAGVGPELETGVDAIDLLMARAPRCRTVVATRYDGEPVVRDMVIAIRQTWPHIAFLHKGDAAIEERIAAVIDGHLARDNAIFTEAVVGVRPIDPARIAVAVRRSMYPGRSRDVLLALANSKRIPSASELASGMGYSQQYVKSVMQSCGEQLRAEELLAPTDQLGLERLWPWCRARRPILERVLVLR